MAWLADDASVPDNQTSPVTTSDSAMSFDNMDDMFSSEQPAQAELAPAEPAESAPDWLIGMKAAEPTAASAAPTPAEDEMTLSFDDMFSSAQHTQPAPAPDEPPDAAPD